MSIRKMISLHPGVMTSGHVNQALGDAVHHAMYCAKMCLSCADACAAEDAAGHGDMEQCIRLCSDCADVCETTTRLGIRRSGHNARLLIQMLELCAQACDECAAECEKHDHDHCKLCAQICRECAADCRRAAESVNVS